MSGVLRGVYQLGLVILSVDRSLIVTAYQSASGLLNLVNPTFAVVMGGLALGRVRYDK